MGAAEDEDSWWLEDGDGAVTSDMGCASVGQEIKVADLKPSLRSLSLSMQPE